MKKTLLLATMAIFALVGCEKQAQSELDLADVKQTATITGEVVAYQDKANFDTNVRKMDGIRIYFEVAASQFVTGATGNQQFEAITDSEGNFTITVPTGAKAITGKLKTDDIKSNQGEKVVYYEAYTGANITLNAGDVRIESIKLKKDAVLSDCIGEAFIYGVVTYDAGLQQMADGSYEWNAIARPQTLMTATIAYSEGRTKTLTTFSNDEGRYQFIIPVEDAGNEVTISGAEFDAEYTEKFNNEFATRLYHYTFTPSKQTVKDAQDVRIDMYANQSADPIDIVTTKGAVSIKVSGKILKEVEQVRYNDKDLAIGVEAGTKPYVGDMYVCLYDNVSGRNIYYNITTDEKGNYEYTAQVPDDWDLTSGNYDLYVGVYKAFKETDFRHYYLGYETDNDGYYKQKITTWNDAKDDTYSVQKLNVVYKSSERGVALSSKELFFDVKMADHVLQMEPEDENIVLGIGNACDIQNMQTTTPGHPYADCLVASDGIQIW